MHLTALLAAGDRHDVRPLGDRRAAVSAREDTMNRYSELAKVLFFVCLIGWFAVATTLAAAADDEIVAFNTKSLKYHCLTCQWAIKCTRNCITIKKSEAITRGGVACKVCGGSCKASAQNTPVSSWLTDTSSSRSNSAPVLATYGGTVEGRVFVKNDACP
jgi:hypothetical protein